MSANNQSSKSASEKSFLPHNRWQVFADRIKTHWAKYLMCGLVLAVFALPVFGIQMYADMTAASLFEKYVGGEMLETEYRGAVSALQLTVSCVKVVCYAIFAVGLAGIARIVRQSAWSEPFSFWEDFAVGIKQNVLWYSLLFAFLGLINAFGTVVMQTRDDWLEYIPLCINVFVLFPIALHIAVQVAVYKHKVGDIVGTSAYIYLKTLPMSMLFSVLFESYGLFDLISTITVRYVCKFLFVFALPIGMLGWFLCVSSALDKYVNTQNYPSLVDKGVWRL